MMIPHGTTQKILVPQLYVRVKPGDLDGSGSLIAADTLNMNLTGDLNNTGTIAGRKVMNITADNIKNLGGTISADALNAVARLDINNTGGTIEALSSANLVAGRDFNMTTTTQSSKTSTQPRPQPNSPFGMLGLGAQQASEFSQTGIDRVAALYVKNPGGTLSISANNNINLTAAKIDSQGSASVVAGNNINLGTVTTERTTNLNFDANNYNRSSSSKDVGSSITAANNLSMNAGNDLTAKAANVQAGGALNVNAGNDIIILAGEDKQSNSNASKSTSSSWFSSTTTVRQNSSASNKAIASSFSGQSTSIVADNNLVSVGGAFKGADSLLVEGKNEQKFYAAIDQSSSTSHTETHSSFIGISMNDHTHDDSKSQALALGSRLISDKSIQVNVGKSVEFSGADITAPQTTFSNIDPNNPGSLRLNGAIETTQTMHSDKSETASVWQSQSGGGTTVQNLKQTTINGAATFDKDLQVSVQLPKVVSTSGKTPNPNTGAGSVSDVNQAAVQSQIELLSQQPGLGYLKQLMDGNAATNSNATNNNTTSVTDAASTNATGPKVQWQQVQLAHDNWNYSQQGLTPVGAALLSIAIAAYTGGMGMELLGTTTATATGTVTTLSGLTLGTTTAATAGAAATATTFAAGAALNAGFSALASQAAIAMVNNGGDINKTLQQLGSDQSIKNILIAMGTAGVGVTVQGQGMNAVIANTVTGCAAGTVSGSGCEQGAKTAAVMSTAGEAYQSMVGYAANPGPGENRNGSNQSSQIYEPDSLGRQIQADQGMNVIGLNKPGSFLSQGEALSRGLNQIPFVNATAGLHDYIFNANRELNFTLWNVPTMLPAALVSLPAALNNSSFSWIAQVKQPKNEATPPAPISVIRIDKPLLGFSIKTEGAKQ
jgi:filamentous hemagglutinin